MIFAAGAGLLMLILGGILWTGMATASPVGGARSRLLTLLIFIALSSTVYGLSGEPDYTTPRLSGGPQQLGAALRPDGMGPLEVYGGLVQSGSLNKTEWLNVATDLRAGRRSVEAADAFSRAADLSDEPSERASLFGAAGETLVMAKAGVVSANAVAAFTMALEADADSLGALFYLGREARARSDDATARRYWSRFLDAAPAGQPLIPEVRGSLALLDNVQGRQTRIAPALTPEMIEQFDGLNAEDRHAFVVSMLERQRSKLDDRGDDATASEWRELARAYLQVNELTGSKAAYDRAFELAPDDKALAMERAQLAR